MQLNTGNIAASIFWPKARAGWREKQMIEVSAPDGALANVIIVPNKLLAHTSEQLSLDGSAA